MVVYWIYLGPVSLYYLCTCVWFYRLRRIQPVKKSFPIPLLLLAFGGHTANFIFFMGILIPLSCSSAYFFWQLLVNIGFGAFIARSFLYYALSRLAQYNLKIFTQKDFEEDNWFNKQHENFGKIVLAIATAAFVVFTLPILVTINTCRADFVVPFDLLSTCTCDDFYGYVLVIEMIVGGVTSIGSTR